VSPITCQVCGQTHPLDEIEGSFTLPDVVANISRIARLVRVKSDRNFCILDNKTFFVRCLLPIPLHESSDNYCWGVWVQLSEDLFKRAKHSWSSRDREHEAPLDGVLANNILLYELGTLNLPVQIKHSPPGIAPTIRILSLSHPLAIEQENGVSVARAMEYNHFVLHRHV